MSAPDQDQDISSVPPELLSDEAGEREAESRELPKPDLNVYDEDGAILIEDTDGRGVWNATSRYEPRFRRSQAWEAWYLFAMLLLALLLLVAYSLGLLPIVSAQAEPHILRTYLLLCTGGLLGGTVYGAKWLYHAVAKGLWHQDRRIWRFLSPWISVGSTLGVGTVFLAGFFRAMEEDPGSATDPKLLGLGFIIGYFSDKALAKMKDILEVLFGETRSRPAASRRNGESR